MRLLGHNPTDTLRVKEVNADFGAPYRPFDKFKAPRWIRQTTRAILLVFSVFDEDDTVVRSKHGNAAQ